jgi:hypothetical protein
MTKRQRNRNKMFAHIERWRSSGLTQRAYCRKARINHGGFYYWLTQYKEQIGREAAPASFIPVSVQGKRPSNTILSTQNLHLNFAPNALS